MSTGRSYVRVHNSANTLSATADGDSMAIIFSGFHGPQTYVPATFITDDVSANNFITKPVVMLRAAAGNEPNLGNLSGGLAQLIGARGTAFDGYVPSRLIGIAVEVHDVTAPLYRKGTITAVHASGNFSHQDVQFRCNESQWLSDRCDSVPALPSTLAMMESFPRVYTGALSKGIYIQGRMSKAKHPAKLNGLFNTSHAFAWPEVSVTTPGSVPFAIRGGDTLALVNSNHGFVSSGFQPFAIRLSGLPAEGEYRVTVRTIVEYFPEADDPSSLGISTPSPPFCPAALEAYQQAVIQLPTAVPVSMNAAGDFWRMARAALFKVAPLALKAVPAVAGVVGGPQAAVIAQAVTSAASPLLDKLAKKYGSTSKKPVRKANQPRSQRRKRR
jgi:hypothetical protein